VRLDGGRAWHCRLPSDMQHARAHDSWRKPDNRLLARSGAGTPMGELLRRFWLPVLLTEELPEPDGPPKKITVMGEPLLCFRDTRGRVGIIDPHLPASRRQPLVRAQ